LAPRQPWYKQYPSDWRGDTNLRACSLAARGLWTECLGIMHEADPRGHLIVAGLPVTVDQLALHVGRPLKEVRAALDELMRHGVPSVDESGVVYSRRMVRDTAKSEKASADGARGGNPKLKPTLKGHVNGALIPACAQTRDLSSKRTDVEVKDEQGEREREPEPDLTAARFETFWDAYPNKARRQDAEAAFAKLNPDVALFETILDAVARHKASSRWREPRYIPHPHRWLEGRRWVERV
jgi:hypothetical protein